VQSVGVATSGGQALGKPGSAVYKQWHDALLEFRDGEAPRHGAIWLTQYPLVMVEYYPHVLVVSSLHPRGPRKTLNVVEFFYPEEIHAFEREFIETQQAAYMETCVEDDEIALRMDAGRSALLQRGDDEAGPYQSPMEDGMEHFHQWYRRKMAT
jgi:phenylpropionate dioxygenase-like ring-hydroxylating dioxygenase large terminal subunit